MLNWKEIEETIRLFKEAQETGEEFCISCPVDKCEDCPYEQYCGVE